MKTRSFCRTQWMDFSRCQTKVYVHNKTGPLNPISYHLTRGPKYIVVPPRSPASVPEPIGTPSDSILHWSKWLGFAFYYVNDWFIINFQPHQNKMQPFWNVLFWNLLRTEYALFRMCSKQNVLKMKLAVLLMCEQCKVSLKGKLPSYLKVW